MERNQKTIKNSGTLYHLSMDKKHGSVRFIEKKLNKKDKINRTIGAALTSLSMAVFIYSYGPIVSNSLSFSGVATPAPESIEVKAQTLESSQTQSKSDEYYLVIPSLNIKANIIKNVDPGNQAEYSKALMEGVAQAKGTGLPGEGKRIFLFAHSTNSILFIEQFNAIFYDLDKLELNEKIDIQNGNNIYQYQVTNKKIVSSTDTQWIAPHDGEELILQTCWPKGTNWKRLLVFAKPV